MKILRNIPLWCSLILLVMPLLLWSQESNEERLQALINEALARNLTIEAAAQRVISVEKSISQVSALPDPKLTLGLMNLPVNSFAFDQEPMSGKLVSVMQMFPLAGKLGLNEKMAELAKSAEEFKQQETTNHIIAAVKSAYFNLYAVDRGIETVLSNKALMEQLVNVAQTKYATGSGLQQDVLRAQVELSKIEDDLLMWRQKRVAAVARLNALLNRSEKTEIPVTPAELNLTPPTATNEALTQTRPLLKAWQEMVNRSETAVERKRRDYWPDLTIGASYSQRDDLQNGAVMHDFFSATATINIPLYFKSNQRAAVEQKQADLLAMEAQYRDVLNNVRADSVSVAAELERNRKRVELFDGSILLQAEQSLQSALSGYQVGKVDFLTLINNWTMLQNYQLMAFRARADYRISLAKFEQIVGKNAQ